MAAHAAGSSSGSHRYFLSVVFPHREMTILDYNRVVRDLNGRTPEQLMAEIGKRFAVAAAPGGRPTRARSACTSAAAGIA